MIQSMLAEIHLRQGRPEAAGALLDQLRSLRASMPAYHYEPELLRAEAEWLPLAGRQADTRKLLLKSSGTARQHSSWALAIRPRAWACGIERSRRGPEAAPGAV